ncbi:hypothetical protein XM38_018070 [Halomicronema hongdechloris C2206]|uniref:Peptidase S26 domain-containing protein n=2 Tax=Halomicronema hongdechloris TaxID=1209493 RepID=A0A1Z3HKM9_9CYAN|nr:hypothetical protein XM38_018070 [Halomicronema hongdechloris C2206]
MLPLLFPGQEVLVDPTAYRRPTGAPRLGDLVIAYHPYRPGLRLIKYVAWHTEAGYFLQGLNPAESSDSREFGPVTREHLLGQVVCRFP